MAARKRALVVDIGSTTTKALLFERRGKRYELIGDAQAATTVEAPTEDVTVGLVEAIKALGAAVGRRLLRDGRPVVGEGIDAFLATSSAGGGLQILVSGLARSVTAKSAYRAACAAGGVLLDVLAIDDGRMPHEKVEAIEHLRPDMILIAGGVDGGDVGNVVRMTSIIMGARLKPKYVPDGKMVVIFAGNADARRQIESLLGGKVELKIVDNLRPALDRENLEPTSIAIHELFTEHVMARAPGYPKVGKWTTLPVEPTPAAVERMLEALHERKSENMMMVDIGGATTDVFSCYEGGFSRTVSASLGMSYSASNVLLEAGVENVMRWLTKEMPERLVRNMIANKCINPTRLPRDEVELELEQALARAALSRALKTHREMSVRLSRPTFKDWIKNAVVAEPRMAPDRYEHHYIDMGRVSLLFGSGGVLSKAPRRWQAAMMMIDGLEPVGVTTLGVDSIFMTPHLGMLAALDEDAACASFETQCFVPLGACVSFSGPFRAGKPAGRVVLRGDRREETHDLDWGDFLIVPADEDEEFEVEVTPARRADAGAGRGRKVNARCRGGAVGVVIDARGRPVALPVDEDQRKKVVAEWRRRFEETCG